MAHNSSSDESCKAPGNFHVSSGSNNDDDDVCDGAGHPIKNRLGNGNDNHHAGVDLLLCPLCCKRQRRFHCRNCVKNGSIAHSALDRAERESNTLFEKQQKYLKCQASLRAYSNRYERLIQQHKVRENREFEIKQKREQLSLLKQLVTNKRHRLQALCEQRDELHTANVEKQKFLSKYPIKVKTLEDHVLDHIAKVDKIREDHQKLLIDLKVTTRRGIKQLVEYIFPITEIMLKDEQRKSLPSLPEPKKIYDPEKVAALADAKHTTYIRGKWVFHGSGISEVQYRIVGPSLPANGDYSAYMDWLAENKDDVPKTTSTEIIPSRFEAFKIVGALTYTAQLTQLMSFYLNVRLPQKVAYGDFCRKLNEEQFKRKVSRVNSNIMYLAYTQQVRLRDLCENHTLENMLAILDDRRSDLGRHGHHEVNNAPFVKSVDSLLIGIETATESESEDDDNSLHFDWESVSNLPTPPEMANSNLMPPLGQQSTIAEGLITSAASRISSLLRWIK